MREKRAGVFAFEPKVLQAADGDDDDDGDEDDDDDDSNQAHSVKQQK